MSDVSRTFVNIYCLPEALNSCDQLLLVPRLDLTSVELLELVPKVLYWVDVGRLCWCSSPVNTIRLHEYPCYFGGMLGVIVLHKVITIRVDVLQEWKQGLIKNLNV